MKPRRCAKYQIWTVDDYATLHLWWGIESVPKIAKRLGRTIGGVVGQAKKLKLRMGIQNGYESITEAAERHKCGYQFMLKLLRRRSAKLRRARPWSTATEPQRYISRECADEAMLAYLSTETMKGAARARGIDAAALRKWMLLEGHEPPRRGIHWRVSSGDIDKVVAKHSHSNRDNITLVDAMTTFRVGHTRLRRWLIEAGFEPKGAGHSWVLNRDFVAKVVAKNRPKGLEGDRYATKTSVGNRGRRASSPVAKQDAA